VPSPISKPPKDAIGHPRQAWLKWHPAAVGLMTFALVMVPLLVVVWNMYVQADDLLKSSIQERLVRSARVMAMVIDVAAHEALKNPEQDQSDEYKRLVRKMAVAREAVDSEHTIKFTYTCILDGDEVRFVLDTTPDGDENKDGINDRAMLMEIYEHPSPTLLKALKTGVAQVDVEPYSDRWGTFMSGYAPILDSKNQVVAVAAVDMSLKDFVQQRSALTKVAWWSVSGVLFMAYLAGAWMAWYHHWLQRSISELVRASDAAAAAERVKADFLGAMSHELRTPLNGVLGMSEMLGQTPLDDTQREMLQTVTRSGESLLSTLTSILEFSQLDSRRSLTEPEEAGVRSLVRDVLAFREVELQKKGLTFTASFTEDCPARFTGPVAPLRQILSQLLSNAIKFTDTGGVEIIVSATPQEEGGRIRFSIRDTGIGIGAGHLERLFEPLFQVDGSTTRRHGGTGMGLALCKRLGDAINARLWVESVPGKGSTFHVEVSADRFVAETVPPSRRVLLWTDDSMMTMLATRVIEKTGAQVVIAHSPEDLQKTPNLSQIACAVLDATVVPADAMRTIRRLAPDARLIVLEGDASQTGPELADVVLTTPIRPADLRVALG
jgi:signal transduction histidine kinase